jgi:hypothetical protein
MYFLRFPDRHVDEVFRSKEVLSTADHFGHNSQRLNVQRGKVGNDGYMKFALEARLR